MTDPIADMLTRIRNAQMINHSDVIIPFSKVKLELGKILKKEGYIENIEVIEKELQNNIKIRLKYINNHPVIKTLKRISSPGRRIYKKKDELPWVMQGMGVAIISTPQGLITDKQARKEGIGGEVICEIS